MIVRERIVALRRALHKTQEQVAEELFISFSSYCAYERQLRNPPFEILSLIADYYKVSIDYLTGRTDIRDPVYSLSEDNQTILRALPSLPEQTTRLILLALLIGSDRA